MSDSIYFILKAPKCDACGRSENVVEEERINLEALDMLKEAGFKAFVGSSWAPSQIASHFEAIVGELLADPIKYTALTKSSGRWDMYGRTVDYLTRFAQMCRQIPLGTVTIRDKY